MKIIIIIIRNKWARNSLKSYRCFLVEFVMCFCVRTSFPLPRVCVFLKKKKILKRIIYISALIIIIILVKKCFKI